MNLLVVLPISQKDCDLAISLLGWIEELGGFGDCKVLPIIDMNLSSGQKIKLGKHLHDDWPFILSRHYGPDDSWPTACNWLFWNAALHVETCVHLPFLWLEPDCVPMRCGCMYDFSDEYASCGKPFMGVVLKNTEVFGRVWPAHMVGVGIYPPDTATRLASLDLENAKEAWDILSGSIVAPQCHNTKLIQHVWGEQGLPPTFVAHRTKGCPRNSMTLDQIDKRAVLFHRCKDESLRTLIRQRGVYQ
jgi:hypothetical protein